MALFNQAKRSVAARVQSSQWKDGAERAALIEQFIEERPKPAEFVFLLTHPDNQCRLVGSNLARQNSGAAMLEAILNEAESSPEAARRELMRHAIGQGQKEVAAAIEARIGPKSPSARQSIGWHLAFELPRGKRQLWVERALQSTIPAVRAAAVRRYLEDLTPSGTPPPPLLQLAADESEAIRIKAMEALEKYETPDVVAFMIDRFARETGAVRSRAHEYLKRTVIQRRDQIESRLVPLVAVPDAAARQAATELLFSCLPKDEALQLILEHLKDVPGWTRMRALQTLESQGNQLVEPVLQLLAHPDPQMRANALIIAEKLKSPKLVPALSKLVSDPDWATRVTAADLLSRIGDSAAAPALLGLVRDPECRWVALESLAKLGDPKLIEQVLPLLKDPDPDNRIDVLTALAHFEDARLVHLFHRVAAADRAEPVRKLAQDLLTRLAKKLNMDLPAGMDSAAATPSAPLDRLLARAREMGASDVHLIAGEPPWIRHAGRVTALTDHPVLDGNATRDWIIPLLDDARRERFLQSGEIDFSYVIDGVGRHRCNAYRQRAGLSASFRIIPRDPPTFDQCGIPTALKELLDYHQGLILIGGPTGSGKSTTLAAIINEINETKASHVITIEDPVEFLHPLRSSLVNQREVGRHTESFARALRAALREDPDVIAIGELRDAETIRMALAAAETGHLVLATVHTTSAIQAIDQIVESFPPEEHPQVRVSLCESLKFAVVQQLLPRADGSRQIAAFEVLKGTVSVGNLIREGQTHQLRSTMQIGRSVGMKLMENAVGELLERGEITAEAAAAVGVTREPEASTKDES
ncbi:MAG TPA: PilT/PilU family type 4a pilus ATPase [Myxococcaceae bacterium]|nr:PilT/PilU family type 4a pilus ATPase [Myxococcaceae bacterium]